jgi:hypothetical protein
MDSGDTTLIGAFPEGFWFFGEILFRWVPATIVGIFHVTSDSQIANLTEPVALWDVPGLLTQASNQAHYEAILEGWFAFTLFAIAISLPFLALTIYCWIRIMQIRRGERLAYHAAQRTVAVRDVPRTQLRWNRVEEQAGSSNPESWRLAILEADIMLSELLDIQGYKGETIADKMKQVNRAQFNSIDDAWEAHKIRNRIAHEGTKLDLTPRDVRSAIALYRRAFKEFKYID